MNNKLITPLMGGGGIETRELVSNPYIVNLNRSFDVIGTLSEFSFAVTRTPSILQEQMLGYGTLRFHLNYNSDIIKVVPSNLKRLIIEFPDSNISTINLNLDKTNIAQFFNYEGTGTPSPSVEIPKDFIVKLASGSLDSSNEHTMNLTLETDFGNLNFSGLNTIGQDDIIQDGVILKGVIPDIFDENNIDTIKILFRQGNINMSQTEMSYFFTGAGGVEGAEIYATSIHTSAIYGNFSSIDQNIYFNYKMKKHPEVQTLTGELYNTTLVYTTITEQAGASDYIIFPKFPVIVNPELYR